MEEQQIDQMEQDLTLEQEDFGKKGFFAVRVFNPNICRYLKMSL